MQTQVNGQPNGAAASAAAADAERQAKLLRYQEQQQRLQQHHNRRLGINPAAVSCGIPGPPAPPLPPQPQQQAPSYWQQQQQQQRGQQQQHATPASPQQMQHIQLQQFSMGERPQPPPAPGQQPQAQYSHQHGAPLPQQPHMQQRMQQLAPGPALPAQPSGTVQHQNMMQGNAGMLQQQQMHQLWQLQQMYLMHWQQLQQNQQQPATAATGAAAQNAGAAAPQGTATAAVPAGAAAPAAGAAAPAAASGLPKDVGKPESFEALGKTDWCRVLTSTGHKYFFNKKTKQATWGTPEEVKDIVERLDKAAAALDAFDDSDVPDEEVVEKQPRTFRPQAQRQQGKEQQQGQNASARKDDSSNVQGKEEGEEEQEQTDDSSGEDSDSEKNPELEALKTLARRMEDFKQMLREENFGPFALYEKCLPRLVYQPRFSAITAGQRRRLFDRCIKELAAESRRGQKEHIDAFRALLEEARAQGHVHSSSTVETLERRFGHDERWQGGSIPKGEWAAIRRRLVEETVARRREDKSEARDAIRRQFKKFVKEQLQSFPPEDWPLRRREFRNHPSYTQVASAREREQLYQEACEDLTVARLERKRVTGPASILDDAETKKMKLLKADAATAFTNMLVERVKNPYSESPDGSEWPLELLKGDPRFNTNSLTEAEKKELYKAFVREFCTSRVSLFASRLATLPNDYLSLPFAEILEKVQTAKRLFQGIPEEELRPRQEAWKEQRLAELADAFLLFLRQHPDISRFHSELAKADHLYPGGITDSQLEPLLEKLKSDVRFQRLDAFPARRIQLVKQRMEELSREHRRKGPGIAQSVKQHAPQRP